METEARYTCDYCGEVVEIAIDPSAGRSQDYVEDCWVCCRPNKLLVLIDSSGQISVVAEAES